MRNTALHTPPAILAGFAFPYLDTLSESHGENLLLQSDCTARALSVSVSSHVSISMTIHGRDSYMKM